MQALGIEIAGIGIAIEAPPRLASRLLGRYGEFGAAAPRRGSPPSLRLVASAADGLDVDDDPAALPHVELERLDDERFRVRGGCVGSIDIASGRGTLEAGTGFGAVDSFVRLGLTLLAPSAGWVVLHGAAVGLVDGDWGLLLGRSGSGKSTAASALESWCDEIVLARPGPHGTEAASTPYWKGRPGRARCAALVCLERSSVDESRRLCGSEALRAIVPHVIRHFSRDALDREGLARLCVLVETTPVFRVGLRVGPGFAERLHATLEGCGLAPRRKGSSCCTRRTM